ncbi:hypothetical protein CGH29_03580, partial [Vibrio parahaemolyticus]
KEHQQREQALDTISAHLDTLSQRLDAQAEQIGKLTQQQAAQGDSITSLGLDKAALSRLESKFSPSKPLLNAHQGRWQVQ